MQRGVPGVTSPGVTGWKIPRTGWENITVEGCGLLCVLLRLHSVLHSKKHRRHVASETQYKRGPRFGASKESKTQCKRRQAENCECGALKYRIP